MMYMGVIRRFLGDFINTIGQICCQGSAVAVGLFWLRYSNVCYKF